MRSVTLIFLLAVSSAWLLEQRLTDDAASAGDVVIVAQAEATPGEPTDNDIGVPDANDEPAGDDQSAANSPQPIDELTPEEIEAEIRRAQEVLDDPDAPEEFVQSRPLPADIAIDLPSDI